MPLAYLDFDFSDDSEGHGSFDALACVAPAQWPALLAEAQDVLAWAHAHFPGLRGPVHEGGEWDFALQGLREVPAPLDLAFEEASGRVQVAEGPPGAPRLTLGLTITGSAGFCTALREAFALD